MWIFFFLATKPYSRAQRTMMLWAIFFGELGVLALFYGTSNDDPFLMIWALIIDAGVVTVVGLACRVSFMIALRKPKPPEQPKPKRWRLVARQTAPHRPKATAAAEAWRSGHSSLLTDSKQSQFCSDLVHEPGRFRHENWITCKLVLTPRRTLLQRLRRRAPSVQTLVWRQSTRASSLAPHTQLEVYEARGFPSAFDLTIFRGLRRCPASDVAELCGGEDANGGALFLVGQHAPNAWGGLTGWEASARGSVEKVELYYEDPLVRDLGDALRAVAVVKRGFAARAKKAARPPGFASSERATYSQWNADLFSCSGSSQSKYATPASVATPANAPLYRRPRFHGSSCTSAEPRRMNSALFRPEP